MSVSVTPKIALARVDDLLNKVFVIGAALLTVDVIQNALRQAQYLNPAWFWFTLSAVVISAIGAIGAAFWFGNTRYWYRAMIFSSLFTMLTWNYQMSSSQLVPSDFKPWVWWTLGHTVLACAGAFSRKWAYFALIAGPSIWLVVETQGHGGNADLGRALQDSLYTFFFTTVLMLMVLALRDRAIDVDKENEIALKAVLERTRVAVLNRERARYNSILHDQVLDTLSAASDASTERTRQQAVAAAERAIARITRELDRGANPTETYAFESMAQPLADAILRQSAEIEVAITGTTLHQMPYRVAAALWEATLLAVANSITHSPFASKRTVKLRASQRGIKITVSDNGKGFTMSNVHKSALGVRWTIFQRLESLSIKAHLQSKLGQGATWIFEWYP
jgi:signal transduction histidine kinase